MAHLPSPEQILEQKQTSIAIRDLMAELPDRERKIIEWRFGFEGNPRTLQQIADEIHRSKDRVRQIEARAIRRLRFHEMSRRRLRNVSSLVPPLPWRAFQIDCNYRPIPWMRPTKRPELPPEEKYHATSTVLFKPKPNDSVWTTNPAFDAWLKRLIENPRVGELKPWIPWDFRWPYQIGMSPDQAVDFALRIDAASDEAARSRLFEIAKKQFGQTGT